VEDFADEPRKPGARREFAKFELDAVAAAIAYGANFGAIHVDLRQPSPHPLP
jgi:hypothetical protein